MNALIPTTFFATPLEPNAVAHGAFTVAVPALAGGAPPAELWLAVVRVE